MTDNKRTIANFVGNNLSTIPTLAQQNIILKEWLIKVADSWSAKGGDSALFQILKIIGQEDVFRCQGCDSITKKSEPDYCRKCNIQVCSTCGNDWVCEHLEISL